MFVTDKRKAGPKGAPKFRLSFRVGSWPYPQHLTETERLARDKHSSLLRKFVNYTQKSFITLAPGPNVIKLFMTVIDEFSYARAFVPGKLFQPILTNTLA